MTLRTSSLTFKIFLHKDSQSQPNHDFDSTDGRLNRKLSNDNLVYWFISTKHNLQETAVFVLDSNGSLGLGDERVEQDPLLGTVIQTVLGLAHQEEEKEKVAADGREDGKEGADEEEEDQDIGFGPEEEGSADAEMDREQEKGGDGLAGYKGTFQSLDILMNNILYIIDSRSMYFKMDG